MKKNKYKYLIPLVLIFIFFVTQVNAETCEQHEFGSVGIIVYVYDSYESWDFTVENDLFVNSIEVQSVIKSQSMIIGGEVRYITYFIEILHNDVLIDWWRVEGSPIESAQIYQADLSAFEIKTGDTITYRIGGAAPYGYLEAGYIKGPNYVKLCGGNGDGGGGNGDGDSGSGCFITTLLEN